MAIDSSINSEPFSAEAIKDRLTTNFVGRKLFFFDSLPTTMDVADQQAVLGAPEGTVILANDQTAGRGRFDRKWVAKKGTAIATSIILRPSPEVVPKLHMVCSLAVAFSIEKASGLLPQIKWPNDVLVNKKKISGILLTANRFEKGQGYVNAGIGINVNQQAQDLIDITPPATSISEAIGCSVPRLEVFCYLMEGLEKYYLDIGRGRNLLEIWRSYLGTLGKEIRVQWRREDMAGFVEEGYAEDVDDQGRLILRLSDGTRKRLVSGEVTMHNLS